MSQILGQGRVEHGRHASEGNGALLVLVDSRGPYHARSIVDETVLVALEHFGLPYRLLDLALERPTAVALAGCAALIIGQAGLGDRLTPAETQVMAAAVAQGMGLVNFDWDLRRYAGALLEVFGFAGVSRLPIASDLLFVPANDHYITWLQASGGFHRARRMVTALAVASWRADVRPLVEAVLGKDQLIYIRHLVPGNAYEPRHYPVVFAGRWGEGRAVQFTVNPRLWRSAALGHLGGLDDVFQRAIVWVARKPFLAHPIPPFVTMSFDDCSGRHDFRYLDICNQHGFTPLAALFIDTIQDRHLSFLRAKVQSGQAIVNTHAMSYYDLQLYDFGVAPHTEEALQARFARDDAFYQRLGVRCARIMRDHWGEIGANALPYLKQRGRTFINTPIMIDEHKADQFVPPAGEGYWPYNSTLCFYDRLPDDPDFYIVGAFNERHLVDFLTGCTTLLRESPFNDVPKAGEGAAFQIRHGLSNGFYADILTHEQKLTTVTLDEFDRILTRAEQLTARFEKIYRNYDDIALYLTGKYQTWLARVEQAGGSLAFTVAGETEVPLQLSVYTDADDGVERRYREVSAFAGQMEGQ
jgi:hypothetical protein